MFMLLDWIMVKSIAILTPNIPGAWFYESTRKYMQGPIFTPDKQETMLRCSEAYTEWSSASYGLHFILFTDIENTLQARMGMMEHT